jgi:hypothetical protein
MSRITLYKILLETVITAITVSLLCTGLSAGDTSQRITGRFSHEHSDEYELLHSLDLSPDAVLHGVIIMASTATIGITTALAIHNIYGLRSDTPNKYIGIFGTILGGMTVAYGVVLISSSEDVYRTVGVGAAAMGATSIYYGVKSLARVRAKYLENKEHGLSIDPVIVGRDRGKADVGIQISLRF